METIKRLIPKLIVVLCISVFMSSLLSVLIFRNYTHFRDTLIENEQERLLTISDTIAHTLENHISNQQNALLTLARDTDVFELFVNPDNLKSGGSGDQLNIYYQTQTPYIEGVKLFDMEGRVIEQFPNDKTVNQMGYYEDLSHVISTQIKFISRVQFDLQNRPYIYMYQPVFVGDECFGIIVSKVKLDEIYNAFIAPIKSGNKGYASVKTSEGIFFMHPRKDQLGKEVIELRKSQYPTYDWSELEKLVEGQKNKERGAGIYHSIWITDENPVRVKKFNGYSPASIGDDFWIVTVSSDYEEATKLIKKNYYNTILMMGIIGSGGVAVALYLFSVLVKQRKLEDEAKYVRTVKELNTELAKDIEERKLLEMELVKSQRKFIKLFNTGSHLTFIMAAPTEMEDGLLIIEVNDYAFEKLGYERHELLGKTYRDLDVGLNRDMLADHVKSTQSQNQIQFETQLKKNDGSVFQAEVFAHRFELDNRYYLMFVARDISVRIAQEEEIERHRAIMIYKTRLAAMGEMVGNIAHQWRQPLSSLALINSNIQDVIRLGELDEGDLDKLFSKANRIIKNMSHTIDDFRYFFKPKENQKPFMVNDCIHSTLDLCEERMKHHKIKIHLEEKSPLTIVGYPNQLSQVILNLINNAVDSLIENRIENRLIRIKLDVDSGNGKIDIYDNGGGVEVEILNKIFEPYFTTKDFKRGTGLGLYMSRMIIDKNFKGAINVKNEAEGIVFSISIPLEGVDSYE